MPGAVRGRRRDASRAMKHSVSTVTLQFPTELAEPDNIQERPKTRPKSTTFNRSSRERPDHHRPATSLGDISHRLSDSIEDVHPVSPRTSPRGAVTKSSARACRGQIIGALNTTPQHGPDISARAMVHLIDASIRRLEAEATDSDALTSNPVYGTLDSPTSPVSRLDAFSPGQGELAIRSRLSTLTDGPLVTSRDMGCQVEGGMAAPSDDVVKVDGGSQVDPIPTQDAGSTATPDTTVQTTQTRSLPDRARPVLVTSGTQYIPPPITRQTRRQSSIQRADSPSPSAGERRFGVDPSVESGAAGCLADFLSDPEPALLDAVARAGQVVEYFRATVGYPVEDVWDGDSATEFIDVEPAD